VSHDPADLPPEALEFLRERALASLTTIRPDGTPHVVPVGFSWDDAAGVVRIITFDPSTKVANVRRTGRAAVCQLDGPRWITLEGPAEVTADPDRVAAAVAGYAARYRDPAERANRVAIEIAVSRVLGRW
jgi:PPOX class probable F420-dependent enzyme